MLFRQHERWVEELSVQLQAGHREAIGSGRLGCPDFQRLGRAGSVSQLLEPQGLGMVVKRYRSLLAVEHIQDAGVGAAVLALANSEASLDFS